MCIGQQASRNREHQPSLQEGPEQTLLPEENTSPSGPAADVHSVVASTPLLHCNVLGKQHDRDSDTLNKPIRKAGPVVKVGPPCRRHREEEAVYSILDHDAVEEYAKQQTPGSRGCEGAPPDVLLSFCLQTLYSLTAGSE